MKTSAAASPHRLAAQDGALSRPKQRFESAWGHLPLRPAIPAGLFDSPTPSGAARARGTRGSSSPRARRKRRPRIGIYWAPADPASQRHNFRRHSRCLVGAPISNVLRFSAISRAGWVILMTTGEAISSPLDMPQAYKSLTSSLLPGCVREAQTRSGAIQPGWPLPYRCARARPEHSGCKARYRL